MGLRQGSNYRMKKKIMKRKLKHNITSKLHYGRKLYDRRVFKQEVGICVRITPLISEMSVPVAARSET